MKYLGCLLVALFILSGCAATIGTSTSSNTGTTKTTFQDPTDLQIPAPSGVGTPSQLVIADFNGDSYPDIVLLTDSGAKLYLNQKGLSWVTSSITATEAQPYANGVASGSDLVLFYRGLQMELFKNSGAGIFSSAATLANVMTPASMAYAPSKANSSLGMIFVGGNSGSDLIATRGTSSLTNLNFPADTTVPSEAGLKILAGDIDGDGYVDFAKVPKSGGVVVQFFKNSADTSIASAGTLTRSASTGIQAAQLIDMDGDGSLDLVLGTLSGVELYKGAKTFTGFTESTVLNPTALSVATTGLLAADFTGDGTVDLFLTRSGSAAVFYSQTGSLIFSDITSTAFGTLLSSGTSKVYAADIDGNGAQDIVELKTDGSIAVHINNYKK